MKAFRNPYILRWSFWVWISTCANVQVGNYIQVLWEEVLPSTGHSDEVSIYNGAVHGATTLAGALAVAAVGFVKVDWVRIGDVTTAAVSLVIGASLVWMSQTQTIWVAYIGTIFFGQITVRQGNSKCKKPSQLFSRVP